MKISRLVLGAALTVVAIVATAAPAFAVGNLHQGHVGYRETVCAETLRFRSAPGSGARDGDLVAGQSFLVERHAGGEAYGFAYGDINRRGWVQDGWFCAH